ncbi:Non-specific serine/threonine protein kinase [Bertholletia excelsa]
MSSSPNPGQMISGAPVSMFISKLGLGLGFLVIVSVSITVESKCPKGCDLALGSYYVSSDSNLTYISTISSVSIDELKSYNNINVADYIVSGSRLNIPFSCGCISGEFLGHMFNYHVNTGDTYEKVANTSFANLTTVALLRQFNSYDPNRIPDTATLNVTVNCSCGNSSVSKKYGLFITYPLREGETLETIAANNNLTADLLQRYNPTANFSAGSGLVYIPGKALSSGAIGGISVAGAAGALLLAVCIYVGVYRKKKVQDRILLSTKSEDQSLQAATSGNTLEKATDSAGVPVGASPVLTGMTVDKSVEFSYEELAKATNDFSLANKIGEGGFGSVYYAELQGEKAAIKKMDMQASREFLAELNVLTHVHHLNLVRLIGYCVEGSLFLVYEYIENGNLSQHLHGTGRDPLSWSIRVQIALDSARGLEYIHEHTVPVYIHRDIKSANILIDRNFRGKVADFGLTKLTEVGSSSLPTRLVGTFGYMPPEYAQYGDVSPKVDVYAFGVVLYELISAKDAIVKASESMPESRGLVALFDEVLSQPDPKEDLHKLVDPRLGDNYPVDSVCRMAQLAKACTQENPQLRPSMRSIVVALMTLSSSTDDWDAGSFYENQALVNLMSGR